MSISRKQSEEYDIVERVALLYHFKLLCYHRSWPSAGTTEQILMFSPLLPSVGIPLD